MDANLSKIQDAIQDLENYNPTLHDEAKEAFRSHMASLEKHKKDEFEKPRPPRPILRQTHTYVTMDVTHSVFEEVKKKLEDAEYHHAIHDEGTKLDLHGIALTLDPEDKEWKIQYRYDADTNEAVLMLGTGTVLKTKTEASIEFWGVIYTVSKRPFPDQSGYSKDMARVEIMSDEGDPIKEVETASHSWVEINP